MGKGSRFEGLWPWAVVAALCLAAVLWTGWNLRWEQGQGAGLAAPMAAAREEKAMPSPWEGLLGTEDAPIPVNSAGEQQLCQLPGVGPVTARALMAQREAWGSFCFPEDLLNVKGITLEKLEAMAADITLVQ